MASNWTALQEGKTGSKKRFFHFFNLSFSFGNEKNAEKQVLYDVFRTFCSHLFLAYIFFLFTLIDIEAGLQVGGTLPHSNPTLTDE